MKKFIFCLSSFLLTLTFLLAPSVYSQEMSDEKPSFGPSEAEQSCMRSCASVGCQPNDMTCMKKNSTACMAKCNVKKPAATAETGCMESCVEKGCGEFNFVCQAKNRDKCEKSCNMIKEPETKSKEEACIRTCVKKANPKLKCQPGEGGEKGPAICQSCAKSCEDLYDGPCLNDTKLKTKQKSCETCKHCYGEPVIGDSGQGYRCITDVKCMDATDQFGDDPGNGPEVKKENKLDQGGLVIGTRNLFSNWKTQLDSFFANFKFK